MTWEYLDLADYLLIAEAVTGIEAEILAEMPRVVDLASSALAVPASGWQGAEAYPKSAQKAGLLAARLEALRSNFDKNRHFQRFLDERSQVQIPGPRPILK